MFNKSNVEKEQIKSLLEEEVKSFFPKEGVWYSSCFKRPREVAHAYLPCHLRDNGWMSELLHRDLEDKGIYISAREIKKFMDESELFNELRHDYELTIVKWQINFIQGGGEGWLIPEGFDDGSIIFDPNVDVMVRGGVVKTLRAIGMDREVIEEGLEKYASIWREGYMMQGFSREYEPVVYMKGTPGPANESHKKNYLAMKLYKYYQEHKESVDKYGKATPEMLMTKEEARQVARELEVQNAERRKFIENWKKNTPYKRGR